MMKKRDFLTVGLAGILALSVCCVKKQIENQNAGSYSFERAYFTSTQEDPDQHIKQAEFYPLEKHSFVDENGIKRNAWFIQPIGNMNIIHSSFGEYGLHETAIDTNLISSVKNLEENLNHSPSFDFVLKNPKVAKRNKQKYEMLFKTEIESDIDRSSGEIIWKYTLWGNKEFKNLWQQPELGGIGGVNFEVANVVSFTGRGVQREARIIGGINEFEDPSSDNYRISLLSNGTVLRLRQQGNTNVLYEVGPYSLNPTEQKSESLKNVRLLRKDDKKN